MEASVSQIDLFGLDMNASKDELRTLRKRSLHNLLTSYADEADVFVEVIQNAFDAVRAAYSENLYADAGEVAEITIVLGRRSGGDPHYLLVVDNGIGMSPDVARDFTTPGFSYGKAIGETVGYKGVGASFFFAAANKIAFQTADRAGQSTQATVTGAYSWIMSQHEPVPEKKPTMTCPEAVEDVLPDGRGTAIYYEFHPGIKPRSLSHLVRVDDDPAVELRNWASYLCAKTSIGLVSPPEHQIKVYLMLDDGGHVHSSSWELGHFDLDERMLGYPFPWQVLPVHKDVRDIDETPDSKRYLHENKYQAVRLRWTREDVQGLAQPLDLRPEEEDLLDSHFRFVDIFFAYSTDVLGHVHDRLGTRSRVVRYGIRLAIDGVPQGRMLDFDLTRNEGHSRQAHALVAFRDLELDTGRKIPSSEVVTELVRKVTVRAMTLLADYRWAMKQKERPEPSVNLEAWRQETKERVSRSLVRQLFEILQREPPIQVDPLTENDVIALFAVLLSAELLKGLQLVSLSGFNRYDGLINIETRAAELRDVTDPLSARDVSTSLSGPAKVLEFKVQFEDVINDFECKAKRPQDIDLLVCWTLPTLNIRRGRLHHTYGSRKEFRQLYGMTHLWSDENGTSHMPVISLKHFVAESLKIAEAEEPGIGRATFETLLKEDEEAAI